jgi:hypothetical protein
MAGLEKESDAVVVTVEKIAEKIDVSTVLTYKT